MSASPVSKTYTFVSSDKCNMCLSGPQNQFFFGRRLDKRQGLWPKYKPGITVSIFRCRDCGLLYANPMPIPASIGQHYDVSPEEYWSPEYFSSFPTVEPPILKTFQRLYGSDAKGKKVLDIGSGVGKWMITFEKLGFDTYGIEPSASFRNAAVEKNNIRPDRIQLCSIEDAEFPDNTFAFINFNAVVEHLVDPAAALSKAAKWLEPGGLMQVEIPSSAFLQSRLVRMFYRLTCAGEYVVNTSPMHNPYHLYEFGLESFVKHGKIAGYSVVFHEYYPCAVGKPAILRKFFDTLMKWTDTGMQISLWLKRD